MAQGFIAISLLQSPFPIHINIFTFFSSCVSPLDMLLPTPACLLLSFLLFPPFAGFFYITSIIPYLSASYNIVYLPLCNPSHLLTFTCPLYPHFRFFDLFIDSFFAYIFMVLLLHIYIHNFWH